MKTSPDGGFISHSLSHHFKGGRVRRDLQPLAPEGQVYYKINYKGRALLFNLTANNQLVSNDYILERRNGSANRTERGLSEGNSCHLLGTVEAPDVRGTAAISTCKGLVRSRFVLTPVSFIRRSQGQTSLKKCQDVFFNTLKKGHLCGEVSLWFRQLEDSKANPFLLTVPCLLVPSSKTS